MNMLLQIKSRCIVIAIHIKRYIQKSEIIPILRDSNKSSTIEDFQGSHPGNLQQL